MSGDHRIGPYELLAEEGHGAMGQVYRARDTRLEREVALKVLWPNLAREEVFVARFRREAKQTAAIDHPNVVRIYDVGEADGYWYIAMEFVNGATLRAVIDSENRLPVERGLGIFRQVLEGLSAAHDHGVIHRDLKPGNVLIEEETGMVKIVDFGIARATEDLTTLTMTGVMLGTPQYMAPELVRGDAPSRRSDLYAAGCVLYQMLTGALPFDGPTPGAIWEAHQRGSYPPPRRVVPGLPAAGDAVVSRLLAREPADRYPDCRAAIEDLTRWQRGEEVLPALPQFHEEIDEGLARRLPSSWLVFWNEIDVWFRYQVIEVFGRAEPTVAMLHSALREMEGDLRDSHRRFEELFLLRERLSREIGGLDQEIATAEKEAEAVLAAGDEAGTRDILARKTEAGQKREPLAEERAKTQEALTEAERRYAGLAAKVSNAKHRADLLLLRRRRAKLELSMIGVSDDDRRRTGVRLVAAARLILFSTIAGGLLSLGVAFPWPVGKAEAVASPELTSDSHQDPSWVPGQTFKFTAADDGSGVSQVRFEVATDSYFRNIVRSDTENANDTDLGRNLPEGGDYYWRGVIADAAGNVTYTEPKMGRIRDIRVADSNPNPPTQPPAHSNGYSIDAVRATVR